MRRKVLIAEMIVLVVAAILTGILCPKWWGFVLIYGFALACQGLGLWMEVKWIEGKSSFFTEVLELFRKY